MKDNLDYAKIIKAKINLVDFLSKDLRLIKSGSNYKALCPFHNEKTPSFTINLQKQNYICYGCGANGDIFSYVMDKYKLKVHFACTNDDETKVYDMSEAEDPNLINGFLEDKEVKRLRTEAGVNLVSHETLSSVSKYKIW